MSKHLVLFLIVLCLLGLAIFIIFKLASPYPNSPSALTTNESLTASAFNSLKQVFGSRRHATTTPSPTPTPTPTSTPISVYPWHTNITAAVFWVGEPVGNGSSEDNALSAWDDNWEEHYGGYDNYSYVRTATNNYFPNEFTPKENPFYLDLPYNDFNDNGTPRTNRTTVVPWAKEKIWASNQSMMKNQWVKLTKGDNTCYGQIEDAGPYIYNDYAYVFSTTDSRPKSTRANDAGMDVSPALRDCLKFAGLNNVDNKVNWQFINATDVPRGPWKVVITTSQINWP
ncbi:MAG: hypothetical protein WC640_01620 [Candidatus Paceibacterota bacterium]|jgi:hypothetical protein